MKRLLVIFLACLALSPTWAYQHQYTDQSVLANGTWIKIQVDETGIYKMTYEQLRAAGLSDPGSVRVYGYGGAQKSRNFSQRNVDDLACVPVYIYKGDDGQFGPGDYILFYGQGIYSWSYTGKQFEHVLNTYSNYGYYFLSDNAGQQVEIGEAQEAGLFSPMALTTDTYTALSVHDIDLVNLIDVAGEQGGGKIWFGERFAPDQTRNFVLPAQNLTGENVTLRAHVASNAVVSSTIQWGIQSTSSTIRIYPRSEGDNQTLAVESNGAISVAPVGTGDQTVRMAYKCSTPSASAYLDYIEMEAPSRLNMGDRSYMPVRSEAGYNTSRPIVYCAQNAPADCQIWNVTRLDSIYRMPVEQEGNEIKWQSEDLSQVEEFVMLSPSANNWLTPKVVGPVANQNLHALSNVDYVIVCPESMIAPSRRLAQAHEDMDGMITAVVTDEQIYNEFSSGTPDATAIRWFMKMLYDRGKRLGLSSPSYLLIMGDGSFDNRAISPMSGSHVMITYQTDNSVNEALACANDDYFAFMDDESNNIVDTRQLMSFGVGRMPVNTVTEAEQVVDKTIRYMQNPNPGPWKNQTIFLADDGDGNMHTESCDEAAEMVRKNNEAFVVNKIYLDMFRQETTTTGESYPAAKSKLYSLFNSGALFFNYSGHGGFNGVTNEGMINLQSIGAMSNKNLAFWVLATCHFSHWDCKTQSAGELAMLHPDGAAIAVFSACRTAYVYPNTNLDRNLCKELFEHDGKLCGYGSSIGEAIYKAKNACGVDANKLVYTLFGDPAIRLAWPSDVQVVLDSVSAPDTLKAMAVQKFQGKILEPDNTLAEWFNGTAWVTIYDKDRQFVTLNNDNDPVSERNPFTFTSTSGKIYSGQVPVENGRWQLEMMVPKDILYAVGNGRMVCYAYDEEHQSEGIGSYASFLVGGSSNEQIDDKEGPEILHLYLNDEMWKSGGKTHANPRLFAYVSDKHGINTIGSGIGHDITLVIDDDVNQSYILNEYFLSDMGSFRSGTISYPMMTQAPGIHTLTLRVWDQLNNSSSATIKYEVVEDYSPQVFAAIAYPNPVQKGGTVHWRLHTDRKDELMRTTLMVYDAQGRLVWQTTTGNTSELSATTSEMGLLSGIYYYNVVIEEQVNHRSSRCGGKFIVLE